LSITGKITSRGTPAGKFGFGVKAATKRPVENNKREQVSRGYFAWQQTKTPGAVIRPGALREFQFHQYTDSRTRVKHARAIA
jgi:hypothetical protein